MNAYEISFKGTTCSQILFAKSMKEAKELFASHFNTNVSGYITGKLIKKLNQTNCNYLEE